MDVADALWAVVEDDLPIETGSGHAAVLGVGGRTVVVDDVPDPEQKGRPWRADTRRRGAITHRDRHRIGAGAASAVVDGQGRRIGTVAVEAMARVRRRAQRCTVTEVPAVGQ